MDWIAVLSAACFWLVCGGMLADLLMVESWWAKVMCFVLGPVAFVPLFVVTVIGYAIYEAVCYLRKLWLRSRGQHHRQKRPGRKRRRPA